MPLTDDISTYRPPNIKRYLFIFLSFVEIREIQAPDEIESTERHRYHRPELLQLKQPG